MVRTACRVLAVAVGMMAVAGLGTASFSDDPPSIKDIMGEGHKGKKSILSVLNSAVKEEKWDDTTKPAKKLKEFGEALGKNSPPKGSEESWKKFTETYKKTTAAVFKAVDKKDKAAAEKGLKAIGDSCKGCHSAHR